MIIEKQHLKISRVEIIKKIYDSQGRVIEEQWEYYHPKDEGDIIQGFKTKKK